MNDVTRLIMAVLRVNETIALKVQKHMDSWFEPDYSEMSTKELHALARRAYLDMGTS